VFIRLFTVDARIVVDVRVPVRVVRREVRAAGTNFFFKIRRKKKMVNGAKPNKTKNKNRHKEKPSGTRAGNKTKGILEHHSVFSDTRAM